MKALAKDKGAQRLRVGLLVDNTKAQSFYELCGLKPHELIMEMTL